MSARPVAIGRRRQRLGAPKGLGEVRGLAVADQQRHLPHGQRLASDELGRVAKTDLARNSLKLISPTSSKARCICRGELASARATTATVSGRR
jgi:hypothetical protein